MNASPVPSLPLPGDRVPLPEGLTRLADGSLRADGVDGVAVISPAAGSRDVSVDAGLRVLEALGGTNLPTVGPTTSGALTAPSTSTGARRSGPWPALAGEGSDGDDHADDIVQAEPGDETTLLKPITLVTEPQRHEASGLREVEAVSGPDADDTADAAGTVPAADDTDSADGSVAETGTGTRAESSEGTAAAQPAPGLEASAPELLDTGVWEDPDDLLESLGGGRGDSGGDGSDTSDIGMFPDYPEPEPGSGRRRRGAHRAPSAPSASSGEQPTADTPTAPDNSKSKQPQPVRAPQPLEALPATEVVSASEAALIAAPPVRASICPQGHANPPEIRECLICAQPLTGVFSYVRRPALATLTLSSGAAVEVAGDVVVGRAPQPPRGGDPHIVALVAVPSPQHMVSRSHLMLTISGWSILAQDLGSSNGTVLARPGATPVLLGSGMPTPVFMGDLMDVGDGVTLRIDPPAWLRPRSG